MHVPLIAKILTVAAVGGAGLLAVSNSSGGVSVAGPVCVTHTAQPGTTVTATANIVNDGQAAAKVDLSTDPVIGQPLRAYPQGGYPVHKTAGHRAGQTWAEVSGPYTVPAGATVQGTITVHVGPGAPKGPYGTMVYAVNYGHPNGSGDQVGTAGGAGVYFAMSVGIRPPPHCGGQQDWPWASDWTPPLPVCHPGQPPLRGQQAVCRVLPLPPPAAGARNCHWPPAKWTRYMGQLRAAGRRYARNPDAYLADAHCVVDGRVLNGPAFYAGTGMYRYADTHQAGPVSGARPANNSDSWRTAGSS